MSGILRPAAWAVCAVAVLLAAVPASADEVIPVYSQFGIYKDVDGDGQFSTADLGGKIGCIGSMNQWLSAGTSYGYKQFTTPGASGDFSAAPSNTAGYYYDPSGNTSHNNWLQMLPDTLQFYMAYSRLDHDPADGLHDPKAAQGFNLGIYMNAPDKLSSPSQDPYGRTFITHPDGSVELSGLDNPFDYTIFKPTEGVHRNTVALDIAVLNSQLNPSIIVSDDATFTTAPPREDELPRPYPGDPLPGMELKDSVVPVTGYDAAFEGVWNYNDDTTDGGVIGNLLPDVNDLQNFVIRITLSELGNDAKGIQYILFNTFSAPGADPYDQTAGILILPLIEGESFFIVGCCDHAPEPMTLSLLGLGGLGLAGGWSRRRLRRRNER